MTLGSHQRTIGFSQSHITPRWILDPLGTFDLDPCASSPQPWPCATMSFTEADDGLSRLWHGRVWLNPPFDTRQVARWINRLIEHGQGTLLVHARTDTKWFQPVFSTASAILFLKGRVIFHKPDGSPQTTQRGQISNSGAPVVLCAFGDRDADLLAKSGLAGSFVSLNERRVA